MVGDIVGYVYIKKNPVGMSAESLNKFSNKICEVIEFAVDGGCLCINPDKTALGMFDKSEIVKSFECSADNNYILPPNLNEFEKMVFKLKLENRKGGYDNIVKSMIIVASLHAGKYTDELLFQNQ